MKHQLTVTVETKDGLGHISVIGRKNLISALFRNSALHRALKDMPGSGNLMYDVITIDGEYHSKLIGNCEPPRHTVACYAYGERNNSCNLFKEDDAKS